MTSDDLTFALPGQWWRIPVQDSEASARSIRAFVTDTVGRADEHAQLRADLRQQLTKSTDDARSAQGREVYLTGEIAPGVPLSITLTTYRPELPTQFSASLGVDMTAESFASRLRSRAADADVEVWSEGDVAVVRDFRSQLATDEEGNEERTLRLDYWLLHAGTTETVLLSFTTPVIWEEAVEAVLELVDAIISTVDWQPAVGEAPTPEPVDRRAAVIETRTPDPVG